jgi:hypothetical protein
VKVISRELARSGGPTSSLTFLPWRDAPFISSALRIRTIYGGLEPSLKLSFEACHQQGHRKKWR